MCDAAFFFEQDFISILCWCFIWQALHRYTTRAKVHSRLSHCCLFCQKQLSIHWPDQSPVINHIRSRAFPLIKYICSEKLLNFRPRLRRFQPKKNTNQKDSASYLLFLLPNFPVHWADTGRQQSSLYCIVFVLVWQDASNSQDQLWYPTPYTSCWWLGQVHSQYIYCFMPD